MKQSRCLTFRLITAARAAISGCARPATTTLIFRGIARTIRTGKGIIMAARNPVISVRLSDLTRKQMDELTAKWGCSMADVITVLIDRVYQRENMTMKYSRRQHLIEAIAGQIDLILDQPELIEAKNRHGFAVDVRWQDGEYISDNEWTRVSDIHLSPDELRQAIQIASHGA
jgi:antitoxin component of RelBE/YafQ-DinJ toxin-antitoxin module